MLAALRERGANVKLTVYPRTGHKAWDKVYRDSDLAEWLIKWCGTKRTRDVNAYN
jgi:hypothetical protein